MFTVGQKVTIAESRGTIIGIATVAKAGARKLTLSDGSDWNNNGSRRWGAQDRWYMGPWLRIYAEGDESLLQKCRDYALVSRFQEWPKLTDEHLHAIAMVIRQHRAESAKEPA